MKKPTAKKAATKKPRKARKKCPYFNCSKPSCPHWQWGVCGVLCRKPKPNSDA